MNLSVGTANWDRTYGINKMNEISRKKITNLYKKMLELKIFDIDTAFAYGSSHTILSELGSLDLLQITTKIPSEWVDNLDSIPQKLQYELERLKLGSFETILFHDSYSIINYSRNRLNSVMQEILNKKICKRIGVSIYSPKEIGLALNSSDLFSEFQFPINPFNQAFKEYFQEFGNPKNFKLVARSVFLQGLLTMPDSLYPKFFLDSQECQNWKFFLRVNNIKPEIACIKFVSNLEFVDKIVVGVNSSSQLENIANVLSSKEKCTLNFSNLKSNNNQVIDPREWKYD